MQASIAVVGMEPREMKSFKEMLIQRTLVALWWLLFGGACLWLLIGSVAYWVKHGWLPADTDGWVQAIGSLLAVLVIILVSRLERSTSKDAVLIEQYEYMQKALALAAYAAESIAGYHEQLNEKMLDQVTVNFHITILKAIHMDMDGVEFTKIADYRAAVAWADLKRSISLAISTLELSITHPQRLNVHQAWLWKQRTELDLRKLTDAIAEFGLQHSAIRARFE